MGHYETIFFRRGPLWERGHKHYLMYLGDRIVGELFHSERSYWTAISRAHGEKLRGLRMVDGFHRKEYAMEYILNVGVRGPDPSEELQKQIWKEAMEKYAPPS